MRTRKIRLTLALTALLFVLQWSRPASADVTITGTVGEIVVGNISNVNMIRFKLTDANQTATCTSYGGKYAWLDNGVFFYREVYALLLVSKKGAPINCVLVDNMNCYVRSCTLP